jgi:hypothetical protein
VAQQDGFVAVGDVAQAQCSGDQPWHAGDQARLLDREEDVVDLARRHAVGHQAGAHRRQDLARMLAKQEVGDAPAVLVELDAVHDQVLAVHVEAAGVEELVPEHLALQRDLEAPRGDRRYQRMKAAPPVKTSLISRACRP